MNPDGTPNLKGALDGGWAEELEGQPEGMPHGEQAREPEEARAGIEDRISCPEIIYPKL